MDEVDREITAFLAGFPASLLHYVHTYRGHRPRVANSCTVACEPVAPAR